MLWVPAHAQTASPFDRIVAELGRRAGLEILIRDAPTRVAETTLARELPPREAIERLARAHGLSVIEIAPRRLMLVRRQRIARARTAARALPPDSVGDIVVQARRIDESSRDVPVALSVLGPRALRERQVRRLDDLTGVVPGLIVTSQTSGTTPLFTMRGQRRAVGDNLRLPVVTYLAEVPLPNEGGLLPVFDLASVQVLRGPQGTLFGRNTTAGAILLEPAAPSARAGGYAEVTVGDYGLTVFEGAVTGGVERLAVRLAVQSSRRGGFVRDIAQAIDLDDLHSDAARLSIAAEPTDKLSQRVVIDWLDADERGVASILRGVYPNPPAVAGGGNARTQTAAPSFDCGSPGCDVDFALSEQAMLGARRTITNIAPLARRRLWGIAATTEYGDARFKARLILGYRSTRVETAQDQDGTPLPVQEALAWTDRTQRTAELQFVGTAASGFDWVGGMFVSDSLPAGDNSSTFTMLARPGVDPVYVGRYERIRSAAVYGEVHVPLTNALRLTAGGRYDHDRVTGCGTTRAAAPVTSETICEQLGGVAGKVRSGAPSWTLGLDRRFGPILLYGVTRRAYRPAGFNVPTLGPALARYQTYRPETLTDVEFGAKADGNVAGWRMTGSVAVYTGAYRDIQRALTPGTDRDGDGLIENDPTSLVINAARAQISGVEAEVEARTAALAINVAATVTDARYGRFEVDPSLAELLGGDPVGNVFSYAPRWTVAAGIRYRIPAPTSAGAPHVGVQARVQGRTYFSGRRDDDYAIQPAYGIVDLDAGWDGIGDTRLSVGLYARNMFDRTYAIGGGVVTPSITTATLIHGAPRTVGLRARVTF